MRGIYDDRDQHANGVRAGPAAAAESIIQARTVQKTYDTGKVIVPALRGVGLHIDQGDSYHHGGVRLRQDAPAHYPLRA